MSDEHEDGPEEFVRFEWSGAKTHDDKRLHIVATFGQARVHIDFNDDADEGTRELGKIVGTMPTILGFIRREQAIQDEVDGVDEELRQLLGEGEV